jgi:hypothetical protein
VGDRTGLWLTKRANRDGYRYYFQPSHVDRDKGWKTLRLHTRSELPIVDEAQAKVACQEIAAVYSGWRQGRPGYGPHLIDELGRVVREELKALSSGIVGEPGTIAAIVADFLNSDEYLERKAATRNDYRLCLEAFVKKFGTRRWDTISAKEAKEWVREKKAIHPSMAHQWYRTCRAMLNKTRLIYDEREHPGYVPEKMNPFDKLNIGLPKAQLIVWPQEAISNAVALADETGRPSLGDAIVMMAWLGVRRQDWLMWPANIFDNLSWLGIPRRQMPPSPFPGLSSLSSAIASRQQYCVARTPAFAVRLSLSTMLANGPGVPIASS